MALFWLVFKHMPKIKIQKLKLLLFVSLFLSGIKFSLAQDELVSNAKIAIKSGNSKSMSKYFNDMLDLGFDGNKGSYSKTQAEFVLKDFFQKNPAIDFQYIHKGSSKEGLTYTIGNYQTKNKKYRVLIYIKDIKGTHKIDYLDFSEE
jgi:hypothetical protein